MTTNPPSPSFSTSPPAPSPFLSTFIGFPRLIDLANYIPSSHIKIPDLILTVLHNHDLAHGKQTLAAFLDFENLDFHFARSQLEGEEKGMYFHIQRDRHIVLVRRQHQSVLSPTKRCDVFWLDDRVLHVRNVVLDGIPI